VILVSISFEVMPIMAALFCNLLFSKFTGLSFHKIDYLAKTGHMVNGKIHFFIKCYRFPVKSKAKLIEPPCMGRPRIAPT